MKRILLLALTGLLLTSCGFQPLHSQSYRAEQRVAMSAVQVKVDHSRLGQLLEAEIADDVNPDYQQTPKTYELKVHLSVQDIALFINPDGTSARGDIRWVSNYELVKIADGTVVNTGNLTRVSSYNTGEDASTGYASFVSVEDAKKRGIIELGQDYKLRLANVLAQLQSKS